jgi:WD40 repeat protein
VLYRPAARRGRHHLGAAGAARLWDLETGKELAVLRGHTGEVVSVAFAPDGQRAATGSADRTARVWDLAGGGEIARSALHTSSVVTWVAFSPDGRQAVLGGEDRIVRLWQAGSSDVLRQFGGHGGAVHCVAFSPDGQRILSSSADKTVRLWNVKTGRERMHKTWRQVMPRTSMEVMRLEGHTDAVWGVAFSPDGLKAISASSDGTLRLWDLPKPRP